MRKINYLLLIAVAAISVTVSAQTNLDSLWGVWNDQTQPDTIRLKAMHNIIWDGYLFSQPDSAFYFAQMEYDLAEKSGLKKQMARALNTQGISFHLRGDYPKASDLYQRSVKIWEETSDKKGLANTLNNIGILYQDQGDYPKAIDYYQRSLKIKEEIGNKSGIASSLSNIGIIYKDQGDIPKALDYYQRSLKIKEEIGNKESIPFSLTNIGIIYNEQGDYFKARDYFQKSLKINEENGDKRQIALSLVHIGTTYQSQGDYPQALDYFQRSLRINQGIGDKRNIGFCLLNIGLAYRAQGNHPKALEYFQRSLTINEEIGDKEGIANNLNNIGSLYQKQEVPQKAIIECSKGLLLAKEIGAVSLQRNACQCLYDAYKSQGNGNKALEFHEQMLALDDSLNAEETSKKLQQMEFAKQMLADSLQKEEEKLKVEMAHQQEVAKKDKTRNILMGGGLLLLLAAIGFYSRWRFVKKSRDTISKERDRSENLLLNILPAEIAEELKEKGEATARDFDMVSILFTDFKGFTQASERLSAADLVAEINTCFKAFDGIVEKYNIEKIKTIGDAYMCAGGLPVPDEKAVHNTVLAGLEMQAFMKARKAERDAAGLPAFEMRVGIHTGPVVAGIVGVKKFQYDIWGDSVNTASRMESSGEVGQVNVSEATYELVKGNSEFAFISRGKIKAKGKGVMDMYFVKTV